jgi:formylglycine-generating enzyme
VGPKKICIFFIPLNKKHSMRKLSILFLATIVVLASSCSKKAPQNFALVKGGDFINSKSSYYGKEVRVSDFYIGIHEVTQKEWVATMGSNPSEFKGDNLPVETVNWYDCIEYCNKRSAKEGLKPYYTIDKNKKDPNNDNNLDTIKWTVTINDGANGYRLPTEEEWEYAAGGGQMSKSYTYSGSNSIDKVGLYWCNSGDKDLKGINWAWNTIQSNHCKTKPVGSKLPNELGIYNMSGNVREWCWNWHTNKTDPKARVLKGGGWIGSDYCCELIFQGNFEASGKGSDTGFRVCRSE